MVKHEPVRIVTNPILRNERIERRVMEIQRDKIFYAVMLIGAILILISLMWTGNVG